MCAMETGLYEMELSWGISITSVVYDYQCP